MNRKNILIIIAGILLIAVASKYFPFFKSINTSHEEIELNVNKIAKYKAMVSKRNKLETKLISMHTSIEKISSLFLNGNSPSLAGVDMQNIINDIAGRVGIDIKTIRIITPENTPEKKYNKISIQFSAESTVKQLKEMLYKIESSSKYLKIKDISIRPKSITMPDTVYFSINMEGLFNIA
ncbi:MAG: hypothetical protein HQK76_11655 [Desulfobacterales bacterium]|nr:hypothetical protein [Desulfobacterales bacterium]